MDGAAAPPHEGQANAVLLAFLAEVFGVPKSRVQLLSGHTTPFKKVEIVGVSDAEGAARLRQGRVARARSLSEQVRGRT